MKGINFLKKIIGHFKNRQYALGFYSIAWDFPGWLFRFNQGHLMISKTINPSKNLKPENVVKIGTIDDIDDVIRIYDMDRDHAKALLNGRSICFLAAVKEKKPIALTWLATGKCYVRGMGCYYDFGDNGYYTYGSFTLPEGRGKGLWHSMEAARVDYVEKKGEGEYYTLVEFTNEYALSLHKSIGYQPYIFVTYFKILCFNFCRYKNLKTNKNSLRFFLFEPKGDVVII